MKEIITIFDNIAINAIKTMTTFSSLIFTVHKPELYALSTMSPLAQMLWGTQPKQSLQFHCSVDQYINISFCGALNSYLIQEIVLILLKTIFSRN